MLNITADTCVSYDPDECQLENVVSSVGRQEAKINSKGWMQTKKAPYGAAFHIHTVSRFCDRIAGMDSGWGCSDMGHNFQLVFTHSRSFYF